MIHFLQWVSYVYTAISFLACLCVIGAGVLMDRGKVKGELKEGGVAGDNIPTVWTPLKTRSGTLDVGLRSYNSIQYHVVRVRENKDGSGAIFYDKERKQRKVKNEQDSPVSPT